MDKSVAVLLPTGDMVHTDFALSLNGALVNLLAQKVPYVIINRRGSCIDHSRNELVRIALESTATHFCFIDSDQTFPADSITRLLDHDKRIVSASSVTRSLPIEFTARDVSGKRIDFRGMRGLHTVKSNGFPMMLIDRGVFEMDGYPWFESKYTGIVHQSEDEGFCAKVSQSVRIWVDADLTNEIGHAGSKVYTPEDMAPTLLYCDDCDGLLDRFLDCGKCK